MEQRLRHRIDILLHSGDLHRGGGVHPGITVVGKERDVVGNPPAAFLNGPDRSHRRAVARHQHGGEVGPALQQPPGGRPARLLLPRGDQLEPLRGDRQIETAAGFLHVGIGVVSRQQHDVAVSVIEQPAEGEPPGVPPVRTYLRNVRRGVVQRDHHIRNPFAAQQFQLGFTVGLQQLRRKVENRPVPHGGGDTVFAHVPAQGLMRRQHGHIDAGPLTGRL